MQFFFRTSENTGVGLGPLGMLIVAPLYLALIMLIAAAYAIGVIVALIVFTVRAIIARRRARGAA